MPYDFQNKVLLVTGGAAGIGFGIVQALLRVGARAATIVDIDDIKGLAAVTELENEFGQNRVLFVKTDVTKAEEFSDAFKKSIEKWKCIDIVVNNAGIFQDYKWDISIDTNVTSVVRGTLLGFQYMGKDNGGIGGTIVNIASTFGLEAREVGPIYVGTKHFVIGFSRSLGKPYHFQRTGIKILTMCPGFTDTHPSTFNECITLWPHMQKELYQFLESVTLQPVSNVGRGIIKMIQDGDNGSVWVAQKNEDSYPVEFPDNVTC